MTFGHIIMTFLFKIPQNVNLARFVLHYFFLIFLFISELWDKKCFMLWRKQASIDYSSVMK